MSEDLGKITGFTFKCKGYCIDKDGNKSEFTEKNIKEITWVQENE